MIFIIIIVSCIVLYCIGSSINKVDSIFHYAKAPKKLLPVPKKPPKKLPVPKKPPIKTPKQQPAPGSTSGCILLPSENIMSRTTCCTQPWCKKFQCNPSVMPNESDMMCNENKKLKCSTENNVTYCICDSIYPIDGKCPDGYEVKTITGGACDGRVPPACVCTMQEVSRQVCVKSTPSAPNKCKPGYTLKCNTLKPANFPPSLRPTPDCYCKNDIDSYKI